MAHLLGTRDCIENLRIDVMDLQTIVRHIYQTVHNKPEIYSWRSPDTDACELDVTRLLEKHVFCNDMEENQLSHIVLIELVIDRLVLILQLFHYLLNYRKDGLDNMTSYNSKSIGIIAKKYWKSFIAYLKKFDPTDNDMNLSKPTISLADPFKDVNFKITFVEKGCQTIETFYVGCPSCEELRLQLNLLLKQLFHFHNSLMKTNILEVEDIETELVNTDVSMTGNDGKKCLKKLEEMVEGYTEKIRISKFHIDENNLKFKHMKNVLVKMKKDFGLMKESKEAFEIRKKDLEAEIYKMTLKHEEEENESRTKMDKIQNKLKTVSGELDVTRQTNIRLENFHMEIKNKLGNEERLKKRIDFLEFSLKKLEETMSNVLRKLTEAHVQFKKEQMKNTNYHQHSTFLQNKQESLIKRVEMMDEKNGEMQNRVVMVERFKVDAETVNKRLEEKLQKENNMLREEVVQLNEKMMDLSLKLEKTLLENKLLKRQKVKKIDSQWSKEDYFYQRPQSLHLSRRYLSKILITGNSKKSDLLTSSWDADNKIFQNGNLEPISGSQFNNCIFKEYWSCEYCQERCSSHSDFLLHVTYCVYKT